MSLIKILQWKTTIFNVSKILHKKLTLEDINIQKESL